MRRHARGERFPDWDDQPRIRPEHSFLWDAWRALNGKRDWRQTEMGALPGSVRSGDVESWLRVHGYDADPALFRELYDVLHALDDAWVAMVCKREGEPSGDAADCS